MNIYLVKRTDNVGYDDFDSFIVAAKTELEALRTHPQDSWSSSGKKIWNSESGNWGEDPCGTWVDSLHELVIKYLGEGREDLEAGVILASFNAG